MILIYDMIIIYNHHISSYLIIIYGHHRLSSNMVILYGHHIALFVEMSVVLSEPTLPGKVVMGQACFSCSARFGALRIKFSYLMAPPMPPTRKNDVVP